MTMRQQVLPEWVDYNGHLSEGYYVLVFGFATDALMDQVGMDSDYLKRTGCSLYTVEAHVRYLREVPPDSELLITTRVVEVGAKKLRLCHEMVVDDVLRATTELVALHVDSEQGRATPFPEDIAATLSDRVEPAPEYAGRV
ncbi:thioesterase family protein [Saccharopolyspora tripterygii]